MALGAFVDDPEDMVHRRMLKDLCVATYFPTLSPGIAKVKAAQGLLTGQPLSLAYYRHRGMRRFVARQRARGIAAEVAYSSAMAPYLKGAAVPTFQDFVDADSAKWTAYGKKGSPLKRFIYGREGRLLAKAEARFVAQADRTFLVSPEEAATLRARPGVEGGKVDWYRNGVDTDYWRADGQFKRLNRAVDVVFTGAMDYSPNVEAVLWFAKKVWPSLVAQTPGLTFVVVGAKPARAITALDGKAGISVTGRVPDVRPYLAAARVAVAPLRIARGVQNKVLEAMAMGTPVVASTGGMTGTAASPGEQLLVADTPEETVRALMSVLDDPDMAIKMGAAGSHFIREHYRWRENVRRLTDALNLALERR